MTTARRPAITEREVLAAVLDALKTLGIEHQRQNTGGADYGGQKVKFGKKGNADISATLPDGRRLEIETKRPGKKPTPEQWNRIHEVNAANGCAFWTDDAAQAFRVVQRLIEGWRIEIDAGGKQWVTDETNPRDRP